LCQSSTRGKRINEGFERGIAAVGDVFMREVLVRFSRHKPNFVTGLISNNANINPRYFVRFALRVVVGNLI